MSDQSVAVKTKESREIQDFQKKKIVSMDFLFKSVILPVPRAGDLLEAKFLARKGRSVFFDLGPFGTGIIFGQEFINARDIIKKLKPGETVAAKAVEVEGEQGCVELSLREAKQDIVWQEARELMKKNTPLELAVSGANKGGLVIGWRGLQGFLPTSQLRNNHYPRVDGGDKGKILEELKKLVDQKITLTIITANAKVIGVENGKISLSVKALAPDPWQEIKDKYKKGDIIEGEVLRFNSYGALICLAKGVCGLAHISEFNSENDMREKLALGKKFPFQITLFDPAEHKLTFGFLEESIEESIEKEATNKEKKE